MKWAVSDVFVMFMLYKVKSVKLDSDGDLCRMWSRNSFISSTDSSLPTLASHFFPLKWHFLPIIEVYWGPQLPHRSLEDKSEEVAYGCSMSSIVLSSLLSVSNWAATWKYPQITDDANEPNNQASHQRHPHQRQTRTKVSVLHAEGLGIEILPIGSAKNHSCRKT